MDNLNLLCQTIRFQRTALQNSLAMISAVQQHGERFLKTTLEQSPWIPGEGKDACLFLAGIWRKNLTGVSELVDKNLATMERLTSTGEIKETKRKPAEKPAPEPRKQLQKEQPQQEQSQPKQPQPEQPQPGMTAARKAAPERKQTVEKPQAVEKELSPPKEAEQTAMAATEAQKARASEPPEKKTEQPQGKLPSEKKKPSEPKT